MIEVPKFDERTATDIALEVSALLRQRRLTPDQASGRFDTALIQVFARFSEIVIERLNKAPEKNFLAFLDLLGVSPLPMEAARVPLTFFLAPGSANHAVVRAGTQVAAPPGGGSQRPVIFETESELVVTAAQLDSLLTKDGGRDQYSDLSSALLAGTGSQTGSASFSPEPVAAQVISIPHLLYIAVPANPAWLNLDQLRLHFVLDEGQSPPDSRSLQWEIRGGNKTALGATATSGSEVKVLTPDVDETQSLTKSGDVVFRNLPQISSFALDGLSAPWLCCRLLTPMTAIAEFREGMLRQSQSPVIKELTAEVQLAKTNLPIEQAFHETLKLDVSKDFFPFGERPKFGDTLYLANREAFSDPDARITLRVQLTNPDSPGPDVGIPRAKTHNTQLSWEFWDGKIWAELGTSGKHLRLGVEGGDVIDSEFVDETESLSRDGNVSFRFTSAPAELNLNGQKNYWIRVRIAAGDYGRELQYQKNDATGGFSAMPATLAPPSIRSLKLDYVVKKESKPQSVLCNDFGYVQVALGGSFKPFIPVAGDSALPSLYFGFKVGNSSPGILAGSPTAPATPLKEERVEFPRFPVSTYVVLGSRTAERGEVLTSDQATSTWEYWDGFGWRRFTVADETQGVRKSGRIQFLVPGDFVQSKEFGKQRYWLRMRLNPGDDGPRIGCVLLNTAMAIQGVTVVNDILGSSNGERNQRFRTTQPSVLRGQKLEVREPTLPPPQEQMRVRAAEGEGAIQLTTETPGKSEYWVTWHMVDNFYASGPRDRHYVLDRPKGEVLFGDGICGMIPPVLPGNIRLTRYRSGGGVAGNQPAQTIKQLVSAVPYVQKVVNWSAATGGNDPEPTENILERGPRGIRHRDRAVTAEDFEDLAMLASREVARAKCVPQFDLARDPFARRRKPGLISVVVVPRSEDPKPVPSSDLLNRVHTFLDARRLATAELVVVGPEYVRVDVDAEIVVYRPDEASDVEQEVTQALQSYLHPIRGGSNRSGWDFGRLPQKFDLYVLIERIVRVSHIRNLRVSTVADRQGAEKTGHFLIYCGHCRVTMTL